MHEANDQLWLALTWGKSPAQTCGHSWAPDEGRAFRCASCSAIGYATGPAGEVEALRCGNCCCTRFGVHQIGGVGFCREHRLPADREAHRQACPTRRDYVARMRAAGFEVRS